MVFKNSHDNCPVRFPHSCLTVTSREVPHVGWMMSPLLRKRERGTGSSAAPRPCRPSGWWGGAPQTAPDLRPGSQGPHPHERLSPKPEPLGPRVLAAATPQTEGACFVSGRGRMRRPTPLRPCSRGSASPAPSPDAHLWPRVPTGTLPVTAGEVLPGLGAGHLRPPVLPARTVGPGCGTCPAARQAQTEAGHLAGRVPEAAGQRGQLRVGLGVAGGTGLCASCRQRAGPHYTLAQTLACGCRIPSPLRSADPAHGTAQLCDHSPRCPSSPWGPALGGDARSCLWGCTLCPASPWKGRRAGGPRGQVAARAARGGPCHSGARRGCPRGEREGQPLSVPRPLGAWAGLLGPVRTLSGSWSRVCVEAQASRVWGNLMAPAAWLLLPQDSSSLHEHRQVLDALPTLMLKTSLFVLKNPLRDSNVGQESTKRLILI